MTRNFTFLRSGAILCLLSFCLMYQAWAQDTRVEGVVRDEQGPIPGVTVSVRGGAQVMTDAEGQYRLNASQNAVITFSSVGYTPQEITLSGRRPNADGVYTVNVELSTEAGMLDETVVVGFGTQRKASLVSSITSVNPGELKGPTSNLTTMMAGRISGMIAYQQSGEPGADNAEFFIRGLGSFGAGKVDPLILMDGIESSPTDLARLQPDDIAAFSVLKDATAAAVYGARGANGVILVTTKSGAAGKTKFSFRAENRVSSNTRNFKFADNITYMNLANEAALTRNPHALLPYTQTKIDRTAMGDNPLLYPSNNWIDQLIKDYTYNQGYNLSASGGGERARYYVAGTYNVDNGVLKVDGLNNFNNNIKLLNYSIRTNIDLTLTSTTEASIKVYGQFDDYSGPVGSYDNDGNRIHGGRHIFERAIWSNPVMFPAVYPASFSPYTEHPLFGGAITGYGSTTLLSNPYAEMVRGYEVYKTSTLQPQLEIKQDLGFLTEGLSARAMGYLKRYSYFNVVRQYNPFYYSAFRNPVSDEIELRVLNDGGTNSIGATGSEYLNYGEGDKNLDSRLYMEAAVNYARRFGDKHDVSGMLITILSSYQTGNAGSVQSSLEQRNQGISGRFTYGYDDRYLVEANFGYNGSERFASGYRFGFFPSFGLAYRISNEKYFEPLRNVIDDFKLRATFGWVGNDQIGERSDRFFYLSNVNLNDGGYGAVFGEEFRYGRPGVSISRYANPLITWEKSEQINLGMDLTLFNRSTELIVDAFRQRRYNILEWRSEISSTMGLMAIPQANTGEAESRGVDASINYNNSFSSNWWTTLRGTFTYATSKMLKKDELDYPEHMSYLYRRGYPVKQVFGLIAERLFVDDIEVANAPQQFGEYMGGDIKYRDMNGDGVITTNDMVALGYPTTPEITYGFGGTVGYKDFDISVFFQGSARSSFFIRPDNISPFVINGRAQNGLLDVVANSHWSEENRDIYAFWPRLSDRFIENNYLTSTWWMRDGAFLRLKNVEIGYNIPTKTASRWGLGRLRVYLSGSNLWVWSKFKMWDPEMGDRGIGYPVQSVYNMGVRVDL
ncbi:SusC/RagA family TonB-linked outer membrane protein [Parapedobacter tibetensis]|uniref:SusC/RagA family TonB-linked outer membrane protein n=1 Tax=Parapedobacter tibetensis TaxID=2972951 RepID=UPI00214D4607|nr:TonB-dependent receptor [Parapedobacter tibetensis]